MKKRYNSVACDVEQGISISACAIMKDERENVENWLNNVRVFADEIIVADTGSIDGTREFLQAQPDVRLIAYEWENSFAAAKNKVLEQVVGEWVVFTDADECFYHPECLRTWLFREKAQMSEFDAVFVPLHNVDADDEDSLIDKTSVIRIFKNRPTLCYEGSVHEQLVAKNGRIECIYGNEELAIRHTGYSSNIIDKKHRRNFALLQKEISLGKNPGAYYGFMAECLFFMRKYEEALNYALKAYRSPYRAMAGKDEFYELAVNSVKQLGIKLTDMLSREEAEEFCCNVLRYNRWHSFALLQWIDICAEAGEEEMLQKLASFYFQSEKDSLCLAELLAVNGLWELARQIYREKGLLTDDFSTLDEAYEFFKCNQPEKGRELVLPHTLCYTSLLTVSLLSSEAGEKSRAKNWLEKQMKFLPEGYQSIVALFHGKAVQGELDFAVYMKLLDFVIVYADANVLRRFLDMTTGLSGNGIMQIANRLMSCELYDEALGQLSRVQAGDECVTSEFWLNCGKCFYFLQDYENAMAAFEAAKSLAPDSRELAAYMEWCREV